MKLKGDFHIHTKFSDAVDTPEEMVQKAIELGFTTLGFTDHAFLEYENEWTMTRAGADRYFDEIHRLKEQYKDRLEILCGIEQDFYSPDPVDRYDYVIGSVHGMEKDGRVWEVDYSLDGFKETVAQGYGGDPYAMIEDYFAHLERVTEQIPKTTIVGHIDLVTKYQEVYPSFEEDHPRYLTAAERAVRKLVQSGALFEVNCGAMSRGYRTTPYPNPRWLKLIRELGGEVIITGDCHDLRFLGKGFDQALELVRSCGFTRVATLTAKGREYIEL